MRIAVRRIDGDAAFAGVGRTFDIAGAEGERLAAAVREHGGVGAEPLHLDTRDPFGPSRNDSEERKKRRARPWGRVEPRAL